MISCKKKQIDPGTAAGWECPRPNRIREIRQQNLSSQPIENVPQNVVLNNRALDEDQRGAH